MKKLFILLALAAGTIAFAQDNANNDTVKSQNTGAKWYFGFGTIVNPDFNINNNLKDAGVHRIADVMPGAVIGWEAIIEKISLDAEFATAGMYNDFKDDGYRLIQASAGLKVQYGLIDTQKTGLFAGLGFTFSASDLSVFDTDTTIDINNLTPSDNSGYVRIYNQSFYIGPVVSVRLFKQMQYPLTIKAGYDVNLTNNRWKSEYAGVSNTVRENGNRAYLYLSIPLNSVFN